MWHTHILASIARYKTDCKFLMGSTLHHDDSLSDRTAGATLDRYYQLTKKLWFEEYGEHYIVQDAIYRGEPPNEYFSVKWTSDDFSPSFEATQKMGASSTSPIFVAPPTEWAPLSGKTSDGSPAFVAPSNTQKVFKQLEHMENYVLGKFNGTVGYYHVETVEAYQIILYRLQRRIRRLESDIAMEKCCCGQKKGKQTEQELNDVNEVYCEIYNRSKATQPSGLYIGSDSSPAYYESKTGIWLYPLVMWDACGGACGGAVACSADVREVDASGGRARAGWSRFG